MIPEIDAFTPFDEIRNEISPDEIQTDSFGYGTNDFFLLGRISGDNKNIISSFSLFKGFGYAQEFSDADIQQIASAFCTIGRRFNLILVDSWERKIVDLNVIHDTENYLLRPWGDSMIPE